MKKHVRKYFLDYFENRLKPAKRVKVERHLNQCQECSKYYQKLHQIFTENDADLLPRLRPQPYLLTRIVANSVHMKPSYSFSEKLRYAFMVISLIMALLFGWWLGNISTKHFNYAQNSETLLEEYVIVLTYEDTEEILANVQSLMDIQKENNHEN